MGVAGGVNSSQGCLFSFEVFIHKVSHLEGTPKQPEKKEYYENLGVAVRLLDFSLLHIKPSLHQKDRAFVQENDEEGIMVPFAAGKTSLFRAPSAKSVKEQLALRPLQALLIHTDKGGYTNMLASTAANIDLNANYQHRALLLHTTLGTPAALLSCTFRLISLGKTLLPHFKVSTFSTHNSAVNTQNSLNFQNCIESTSPKSPWQLLNSVSENLATDIVLPKPGAAPPFLEKTNEKVITKVKEENEGDGNLGENKTQIVYKSQEKEGGYEKKRPPVLIYSAEGGQSDDEEKKVMHSEIGLQSPVEISAKSFPEENDVVQPQPQQDLIPPIKNMHTHEEEGEFKVASTGSLAMKLAAELFTIFGMKMPEVVKAKGQKPLEIPEAGGSSSSRNKARVVREKRRHMERGGTQTNFHDFPGVQNHPPKPHPRQNSSSPISSPWILRLQKQNSTTDYYGEEGKSRGSQRSKRKSRQSHSSERKSRESWKPRDPQRESVESPRRKSRDSEHSDGKSIGSAESDNSKIFDKSKEKLRTSHKTRDNGEGKSRDSRRRKSSASPSEESPGVKEGGGEGGATKLAVKALQLWQKRIESRSNSSSPISLTSLHDKPADDFFPKYSRAPPRLPPQVLPSTPPSPLAPSTRLSSPRPSLFSPLLPSPGSEPLVSPPLRRLGGGSFTAGGQIPNPPLLGGVFSSAPFLGRAQSSPRLTGGLNPSAPPPISGGGSSTPRALLELSPRGVTSSVPLLVPKLVLPPRGRLGGSLEIVKTQRSEVEEVIASARSLLSRGSSIGEELLNARTEGGVEEEGLGVIRARQVALCDAVEEDCGGATSLKEESVAEKDEEGYEDDFEEYEDDFESESESNVDIPTRAAIKEKVLGVVS